MAVGEMARRRQRPGTGEQKLDALLRRRGLREQPQRPAEPPRGAFGREPCCCLAGLAQDGNGGDVALARRPLDVVRARRRCRTPRRERLGAPLVGPKPPAAGGGLVDRAPDERVPEAEASRHVGGANEIELQELVDRVHRRRLGRRGRGRRQLGLERIARHRRSFEHEACRRPTAARALRSARRRRRTGPRWPVSEISGAGVAPPCALERPGELLEVERVAAALLVEDGCVGGVDAFAEKLSRLGGRQSAELDPGQRRRTMRPLERGRKTLRRLAGADAPAP